MPTALVTGAAKRIGRAISISLGQAGYHILLHYHQSKKEALELQSYLHSQGITSDIIAADLSNPSDVDGLVDKAQELVGPIDVIINNASAFENIDIAATSHDDFLHQMNINLYAPIALTRDFAAKLSNNQKGHIVNVVDQRVLHPSIGFTSYTLSKTALKSFTENAALELAPQLRINAVAPGPVLKSIHQSDQDFDAECEATPLGHGTTPEEIAESILFLLNSRAITGQMITIDGGQHLLG